MPNDNRSRNLDHDALWSAFNNMEVAVMKINGKKFSSRKEGRRILRIDGLRTKPKDFRIELIAAVSAEFARCIAQ